MKYIHAQQRVSQIYHTKSTRKTSSPTRHDKRAVFIGQASKYLVQLLADPLGDRRAVRRDDDHDDGQALLRVRPGLQLAELERFLVVVAVSFLLVPLGPLALVRLELLHPAHRILPRSFRREGGTTD